MKEKDIIKTIEKYEAGGTHGQLPVIWKRAHNAIVWDINNKRYIDFTSTIFVTNCGHGYIAEAIDKQAKELIHSYTFPTKVRAEFLVKFKKFLPKFCDKIFLASAGSEVTSWAVNLMRAYKNKKIIVHIDGAFHGKTGQAEALSHEEIKISFPITSEQFDSDYCLLQKNKSNIAGIMIETYQGWSARFMNKDYIQKLIRWAQDSDIPVCFDEIQAGFWRTGKKFGYEHYDVEPDLICMGKGLGGGLPILALAGREKYFNVPGLSSTHSGNPLCCAGANAALDIYMNPKDLNLKQKEKFFFAILNEIREDYKEQIKEINGKGLLASIMCKDKDFATEVCHQAAEMGLLVVKTGKESIKLGPPLTISLHDLSNGLKILYSAITKTVLK